MKHLIADFTLRYEQVKISFVRSCHNSVYRNKNKESRNSCPSKKHLPSTFVSESFRDDEINFFKNIFQNIEHSHAIRGKLIKIYEYVEIRIINYDVRDR